MASHTDDPGLAGAMVHVLNHEFANPFYDTFEPVVWEGKSTRTQLIIMSMRVGHTGQGNLSWQGARPMQSFSHRRDH